VSRRCAAAIFAIQQASPVTDGTADRFGVSFNFGRMLCRLSFDEIETSNGRELLPLFPSMDRLY
jgi:hypothetical protein